MIKNNNKYNLNFICFYNEIDCDILIFDYIKFQLFL